MLNETEFEEARKTGRYLNFSNFFEYRRTMLDQFEEAVPPIVGDSLISEYHFTSRPEDKFVWYFNKSKGAYEDATQFIHEKVIEYKGANARSAFQNEVKWYIAGKSYNKAIEPPVELINLKNGVLNLKTKEIVPTDHKYFFIHQLPVEYKPEAECPAIEKFLSEIVSPKDVDNLKDFAGYCLWREIFIKRFIMGIGGGDNGKSVYANLIETFLGDANVSAMTLQSLCYNRFSTADLYGKLANLCPDIPNDAIKDTTAFKSVTGKDMIRAERKFAQAFHFRSYAKLYFSTNEIPRSEDKTEAYYDRWLIIKFPNKFTKGVNADPLLLEKISNPVELSGFLNVAIEHLHGLLNRGDYSNPMTTDEIRNEYNRSSDPLTAFLFEMTEMDPEGWVSKADLFAGYLSFCKERNLRNKLTSNTAFAKSLLSCEPDLRDSRKGPAKEQVHGWSGISLKENVGATPDAKNKWF